MPPKIRAALALSGSGSSRPSRDEVRCPRLALSVSFSDVPRLPKQEEAGDVIASQHHAAVDQVEVAFTNVLDDQPAPGNGGQAPLQQHTAGGSDAQHRAGLWRRPRPQAHLQCVVLTLVVRDSFLVAQKVQAGDVTNQAYSGLCSDHLCKRDTGVPHYNPMRRAGPTNPKKGGNKQTKTRRP